MLELCSGCPHPATGAAESDWLSDFVGCSRRLGCPRWEQLSMGIFLNITNVVQSHPNTGGPLAIIELASIACAQRCGRDLRPLRCDLVAVAVVEVAGRDPRLARARHGPELRAAQRHLPPAADGAGEGLGKPHACQAVALRRAYQYQNSTGAPLGDPQVDAYGLCVLS